MAIAKWASAKYVNVIAALTGEYLISHLASNESNAGTQ